MRDEELGRYLVEAKALTAEMLQRAQGEAKRRQCTLEAFLREAGLVKEHELLIAKGKALRADFVDLDDMVLDMEVVRCIPEHLALRYRAIAVRIIDGNLLQVAMADPANVLAMDDIRLITGFTVRPAIAPESVIRRYLEWAFQGAEPSLAPVEKTRQTPLESGEWGEKMTLVLG